MDADEDGDAAAEAFEALRAEMAQLRSELRTHLVGTQAETADYAPTLGAIAGTLASIERHPALRTTPQAFAAEMSEALEIIQRRADQRVLTAVRQIEGAAFDVLRVAGSARESRRQRRWVLVAAGIGIFIGVAGWIGASGPIARELPRAWALPEKMATATLATDRWNAGARLMTSANPVGWGRLVAASKLASSNRTRLNRCREAASRTGRRQRCTLGMKPPRR
jgi:hypothetical protein